MKIIYLARDVAFTSTTIPVYIAGACCVRRQCLGNESKQWRQHENRLPSFLSLVSLRLVYGWLSARVGIIISCRQLHNVRFTLMSCVMKWENDQMRIYSLVSTYVSMWVTICDAFSLLEWCDRFWSRFYGLPHSEHGYPSPPPPKICLIY